MAIAFARARLLSRATGGNACRTAAYNERTRIEAQRTGEVFHFKHRDAPEHHEVLLPEGASESLRDSGALWNAAEAAEKRKDAQVAREIVLALPANREIDHEDRVELARSFAEQHFVSKGLAVQIDVHAPHEGDTRSERANHHAHLLITTRRIEGEALSAKKARDLNPDFKRINGRVVVAEGEIWGALWRDHQDTYFAREGLDIRVDPTATVAQEHIGPIRMRAPDAEANARAQEIARENERAARDPTRVLETLTRNNATFTERDLDRYLAKHIRHDDEAHLQVKDRVLGHADVRALYDRENGEATGRYTTRAVREQEKAALTDAAAVASGRHSGVTETSRRAVSEARGLREDQFAAFEHACAPGGLKIIEGRAGTGKSYTLQAIREAHEASFGASVVSTHSGYRVIGLAPTNVVAQDLGADGFKEARTVHSELFRLKNGRGEAWNARTLLVVDEAAMMDAKVTGELMAEARRSGAKVILAGDDRQFASIERGGLFTELRERHGSAEIRQVTRQTIDWQRDAANDLSDGRFEDAVRAFARNKAVTWTHRQDEATTALVERWTRDTVEKPNASRFVFAYTNKDVDRLNAELRQVRCDRGELGAEHWFETKHGELAFSVGDRVQFTDTLKRERIYNGNAGTITGIDEKSGRVTATIDGDKREVSWSTEEFGGFRHGYAGTIYKGQGKTIDHTYLLHTHHWRASSAYVALTRQRESAQLFVATETTQDLRQLARQIGRSEVKGASVAYATVDELGPKARVSQTDRAAERSTDSLAIRRPEIKTTETARAGEGREALIPAFVDPRGRDSFGWDSLGRGLDDVSVAAAVPRDGRVDKERMDQRIYLQTVYRDTKEAKERLEEIVARDGPTSAARRIEADPTVLGSLRGREGFLASRAAREEYAAARSAAEAIGPSIGRRAEAESRAEQAYRSSVETQIAADRTPIPKLSERAEAAIGAVAGAKDEADRAEAWRKLGTDKDVVREVEAFRQAVLTRFGEEGGRAMLRAGAGGKPFEHASVPCEAQSTLAQVSHLYSVAKAGESAASREAEAERLAMRQTQGARLKP